MKAYIASPLGFSEAGRNFYQNEFLRRISCELGYDVLDPWKLTPSDLIASASALRFGVRQRNRWRVVNQSIGLTNQCAIEQCDILIAILDGTDVDSGTASEIGYAAAKGKKIEAYRGDFRLSADNCGSTVNLQVEHFIRMGGGQIASSLDELVVRLLERFGPQSIQPYP